jgi:3-methyladenine DNA glycosylase AlkD
MVEEVEGALRQIATNEKAVNSARFFKSGPGQYGEGDRFLGVTVPEQRNVAKKYFRPIFFKDIKRLLESPWHEERLTALLMMVMKFQKGNDVTKRAVFDLYMKETTYVNNWDLVDSSAPYIVGPWLDSNPYKMKVLIKLAHSELLWERRIAMLATFYYIHKCQRADEALVISDILLHDSHDLIQKAVGWMLREIGKRVNEQILLTYLDDHAHEMPRTTLRYAIERLTPEQKLHYMHR